MKKKVVKLKAVKPYINKQAIDILKSAVDDVRSGEVSAIAIVGLRRDGTMMRGWSRVTVTGDVFRMVGSIEKLREEYLRKNIED